jgi:hypothetical protein
MQVKLHFTESPAFSWRDWRKSLKTLVRLAFLRAENRRIINTEVS